MGTTESTATAGTSASLAAVTSGSSFTDERIATAPVSQGAALVRAVESYEALIDCGCDAGLASTAYGQLACRDCRGVGQRCSWCSGPVTGKRDIDNCTRCFSLTTDRRAAESKADLDARIDAACDAGEIDGTVDGVSGGPSDARGGFEERGDIHASLFESYQDMYVAAYEMHAAREREATQWGMARGAS